MRCRHTVADVKESRYKCVRCGADMGSVDQRLEEKYSVKRKRR
jgi:DNA-directed RNA polymerase subunit RPC12/RpoP